MSLSPPLRVKIVHENDGEKPDARYARSARTGGDFIEAVYILDILKIVGRIEGLISLSRYGAVIRADTRSLYGLYFDSIEPPSFATFALLSRRQTVEIDKIRERGERKGVTWRNWRGGNATLIKSRRFWDFTRRDEAKTRRCSFVLRIRSRTAFLALTMTSVTWRLCTRKRRWLLRFGSNYDRGAENSLVCCCHPRYRQTISPGEFWQIVIAFEKG